MNTKIARIVFFITLFALSAYSFFASSVGTDNVEMDDDAAGKNFLDKIEPALLEKIFGDPSSEQRVIVWLSGQDNDMYGIETVEDLDVVYKFDIIPAVVVKADGLSVLEIAKRDFVDKIAVDKKVKVFREDAMQTINYTYNISKNYGLTGEGIKIAVIDTGVYNHSEFGNRIIKEKCFCNDNCCFNNTVESDAAVDDEGHGTQCAGIAAGASGVATDASIMAVKVLDSDGSGYDSDIVKGINWAIENGANVISISFGLSHSDYDECYELGTSLAVNNASNYAVVAVAAGNDGSGNKTIAAPACVKNAVSVGSVSKSGVISGFSSRGPTTDNRIKPDIVAPGEGINSTYLNGQYRSSSGTSSSAPFVAGAAALLIEKYTQTFGHLPSPHLVKTILLNSANSTFTDRNIIYGSGILNIGRALDSINHTINDSIKNTEKIFNASYRTTLYWPENSTTHNNLSMTIINSANTTNMILSSENDTVIQFWANGTYQVIIRANLSEPQQFFLSSDNLQYIIDTSPIPANTSNKSLPIVRMWINSTEGNYTCDKNSIVNITAQTNDSLQVGIYINATPLNFSTSIISNTTISNTLILNTSDFNTSLYNITAYTPGNENYSANSVTYFLDVIEQNISEASITTTQTTTTTTAPGSDRPSGFGGGGGGGGGAAATTTIITTSTTLATTTTMTPATTTTTPIPKYQILENSANENLNPDSASSAQESKVGITGLSVLETPSVLYAAILLIVAMLALSLFVFMKKIRKKEKDKK